MFAAIVALVGVVYTQRRQGGLARQSDERTQKSLSLTQESLAASRREANETAARAEADALAKRYQDAAAQLGHQKPAVRLAGAFAMASLADDWKEQRQQCVDVLCAYLRMSSVIKQNDAETAWEHQVRLAIGNVISEHLDRTHRLGGGEQSWADIFLDLHDAVFEGLSLKASNINNVIDLRGATFNKECRFEDIHIRGQVWLTTAKVNGEFCADKLTFEGAKAKLVANRLELLPGAKLWISGLIDRSASLPLIEAKQGRVRQDATVDILPSGPGQIAWQPEEVDPTATVHVPTDPPAGKGSA